MSVRQVNRRTCTLQRRHPLQSAEGPQSRRSSSTTTTLAFARTRVWLSCGENNRNTPQDHGDVSEPRLFPHGFPPCHCVANGITNRLLTCMAWFAIQYAALMPYCISKPLTQPHHTDILHGTFSFKLMLRRALPDKPVLTAHRRTTCQTHAPQLRPFTTVSSSSANDCMSHISQLPRVISLQSSSASLKSTHGVIL